MRETFEQLVARINRNSFIPPQGDLNMAKPVKLSKGKEFTFKAAGAGGQQSKYPWDEWFNGTLLMIERSAVDANGDVTDAKDYDVETNLMPAKIKTAARRRYKVCQISRLDADGNKLADSLIIKARDMNADERVAEDIKRAEEKEARDKGGAEDAGNTDTPGTSPVTHMMGQVG